MHVDFKFGHVALRRTIRTLWMYLQEYPGEDVVFKAFQ